MRRRGDLGWIGLAAFVLLFDTWTLIVGRETMTAAFGRALHHPFARWPVTVAWAVTTAHLFGILPDRYDPFDGYARMLAIGWHKV